MKKLWRFAAAVCWSLAAMMFATQANAQTTTSSTFNAQIIIQEECVIQSTNTLDFGTTGVLDTNVDATADIGVQCTSGTNYEIRLNEGSTAGGTIANRLMTDGTNTVTYNMYSDAGRTTNWGETDGTDTVSVASATGAVETYTVYGRVPVQTTPPANTYTDTVTVTVAY